MKTINKKFLPNEIELKKINLIQKYYRKEFALVRISKTMLNKSIIDASYLVRKILKEGNIIDYSKTKYPDKILKKAIILNCGELIENNVSYYRPKTKSGDPRFWIYKFKAFVKIGELVYFTVFNQKLLAIPLKFDIKILENDLKKYFEIITSEEERLMEELIGKIKDIKEKGWIKSVSPFRKNFKDVGDTLEKALGIDPNNLISADYKGKIELKTKLKSANTKTTLFSCVPNWSKSKIKSSNEMILKYGYPTKKVEKYPNFIDLYVTVNNNSNNQGLYLEPEDKKEYLYQNHKIDGETCIWEYKTIEERIKLKHPKTAWILAEEKIINDEYYFKYTNLQITQNPLLSQFILLITHGKIVFDWRGRVRKDGTGYKDKGHAFRIDSKSKELLFGESKIINL